MSTIRTQVKGMLVLGLLFLCALSAPSFALESIGKVIVSVGTVEAHDRQGVVRRLKRRSPVYGTDTIVTNDSSKAQVRFSDGSMLALKPNSRFAIETYEYKDGDEDGKAVYNLLKGGMQTITGAIGRKNKENYALKTPTATIGIRGTYYQLQADGEGLIGGVKEGAITVTNKSGTFTIKAGQYFKMESPDAPVVLLDKPPAGLGAAEGGGDKEKKDGEGGSKKEGDGDGTSGDGDGTSGDGDGTSGDGDGTSGGGGGTSGGGDGTAGGGDGTSGGDGGPLPPPGGLTQGGDGLGGTLQTTEGDAVGVDPTPTGFDPQTGGTPNTEETDETPISIELVPVGTAQPSGGSYGLAFVGDSPTGSVNSNTDMFGADGSHQVYFDQHSSGVSVPVFIDIKNNENCMHCQFSSGSALLVENGFNAASGLAWGRWRGDYIVIENGAFHSNLSSDFHYIYSPVVTNSAALSGFSGTARFDYGGGTSPTDFNGNVGTVNSDNSYIQINFDNQAFETVSLDFTLAGSNYVVENVAETPIDPSLKTSLSLAGSGLSGRMETQFVSQNGSGISTSWELGNGVEYYLGVSAFERNSSLGLDSNGGSIATNGTLFTSYLDDANTALTERFALGGTNTVYTNEALAPTYIEYKNGAGCSLCQFGSGNAILFDAALNASTDTSWGRWSGAYVIGFDGFEQNNLGNDYHFIYNSSVTNASVINGFSGVAIFDFIGGSSPTDQLGNVGSVITDKSFLEINFDAQSFDVVNLGLSLAGNDYLLINSASTAIDSIFLTSIALSGDGLAGELLTQFSGVGGEGVSGLYNLSGGGSVIQGVGLFQRADQLVLNPTGTLVNTGSLATTYFDGTSSVSEQLTLDATNSVYMNTASAPTYIQSQGAAGCTNCQFEVGAAVLQDAATDVTTGTSWGRWQGAYIIGRDGFVQNNLGDDYHFTYNPNLTTAAVVDGFSGVATFDFVDGTAPTDQLGNVGTVNTSNSFVQVDFDTQSFDLTYLDFTLAGNNYLLKNTAPTAIDSSLLTSIPLAGDGLFGDLLTQFSGANGYGLSGLYNLSGGGSVIQGVGLFQRADQLVLNPTGTLVNTGSLAITYFDGTSSVSEQLTLDATNSVYMNTASAPTYIQSQGATGCTNCQFEVGAAVLQDAATDVTTGTSWGRWQGAYIIGRDGFVQNNLGDDYHFIYNPNLTTTAVVDGFSGVATFDFVDGTPPTDQLGNVGTVNTSNSFVQVDFNTQSFDLAHLDFTLAGNNYLLKNTAPTAIDSSLLTSIPLAGDGLFGDLLTQFSGANGYGLSGLYNLSGGGTIVQGVGLFQRSDKLSVNPAGSLAALGGSLMTSYLSNNSPLRAQFTLDSSRYAYLDASQALTYVEKVNVDGCVMCQFDIGTASVLDASSHAETGVSWGRWDGGYVVAEDGFTQTNLSNNFHYLYNPNVSAASVINQFSSTATFSFVGGSSPTDQLGNVGSINPANSFIDANFDSQQFTSARLDFSIDGNNYVVNNSGTTPISSSLITSIALSGSGLSGDVLTQFSGASGYGLSGLYELSGGGNQFSGSALFVRPAPVVRVVLTPVDPLGLAGRSLAIAYIEKTDRGSLVAHSDLFTTDAANLAYLEGFIHPTFVDVGGSTLDCNNCQFSRETATLVDDYVDGSVWGRWSGSFKAVNDGALMNVVSDFSYVYKPGVSVASLSEVQNRTTISAQFDISGGPSPMDSDGNVGSWDNNSYITVDFGAAQKITNVNLEMDINATHYQLNSSGDVSINPSLITRVPISGNGFSGEMKAQFLSTGLDPTGETGADGINTSFGASNGATAISGTAVFDEFFGGM